MKMIDFSAHGFEVVAVCEDGQAAAEAYERLLPDVVITDINMPFVSGLQLAAMIDAAGHGTRVIIITGYDDFNYARQAIKSKVASYILKPVTPDEFRDVLQEARTALDETASRQQLISESQRTIHRRGPLVRDQILNRIIQGTADLALVADDIRAYGLDPSQPAFLLALVQPDHAEETARALNVPVQLLQFMLLNVVEELAQAVPHCLVFALSDGKAAILGSGERGPELAVQLQALGRKIRDTILELLKTTVTVGIGSLATGLDKIPASFEDAQKCLDYRLLLPNRAVITPDMLRSGTEPADFSELVDGIVQQVRLQNEEQALALVKSLLQMMRLAGRPRKEIAFEVTRLVNRLLAALRTETGGNPDLDTTLPGSGEADYVVRIEEWLNRFCLECIRHLRAGRHGEQRRLSALARQHIREHAADSQLSLMQVCNHLSVSLSHFSTLFKEETGSTFIEFLTDVRMERAKELLLNTDQMLYAIAEQVGYDNPAYFTVAFKKQTGMSPREFRKRFGRIP